MTKELKQEYTLRITQANKTQLITILYEMALLYVGEAEDALATGDRTELKDAVRRDIHDLIPKHITKEDIMANIWSVTVMVPLFSPPIVTGTK